ncbi:Rab GTPase-activating protein [Martiniozyma asiatica (nom. inval.)]|nr:Rab GTPase-activating protein [Martiniozyma asiatica]
MATPTDHLGFIIGPSSVEYNEKISQRQQRWSKFLMSKGCYFSDSVPARWPSKSKQMRLLVRKGVPRAWRGSFWIHCLHADKQLRQNPGYFDSLTKSLPKEISDAIEKDLHRTFPDNVHFQDPQVGVDSIKLHQLRMVLHAYALHNPKVGYCQSLNFLSAMLLLHMEPENAFWCLVSICDHFLPHVHEVTLHGLVELQNQLETRLRQNLPSLYGSGHSQTLLLPTTSWFMSLFITTFPPETTIRLWDLIFYEGPRMVLIVAEHIFRLLLPIEGGDPFQIVQNEPRTWPPEYVLKGLERGGMEKLKGGLRGREWVRQLRKK